MLVRKFIAYSLIAILIGSIAAWAWLARKRKQRLREERHGPRDH